LMRALAVGVEAATAARVLGRIWPLGCSIVFVASPGAASERVEAGDEFDVVVLGNRSGCSAEAPELIRLRRSGFSVPFQLARCPEVLEEDRRSTWVLVDQAASMAPESRSAHERRERLRVLRALEDNDWNVSATARALGIGRGKLRSVMLALRIDG